MRISVLVVVWLSVFASGCASWTRGSGTATDLPAPCPTEESWAQIESVDAARNAALTFVLSFQQTVSGRQRQVDEMARLQREDELEAYCIGINAYREARSR